MTAKKFKNIALDGLLTNNPTLRLVLGTCPNEFKISKEMKCK